MAANMRILFDSGSQLNYITLEARDMLQLNSLGTFNVSLKTFGNSNENKQLEKVKFFVQMCNGSSCICVEAFISAICYPIEHQVIDRAKTGYVHLRNLQMADENPANLPLKTDILVGVANYWDFITGDSKRGQSGPVALGSKLRYILSVSVEKVTDCIRIATQTP